MRMQTYPEITDGYVAGKVTTQIKVQNSADFIPSASEHAPRLFEGEAIVDTSAVHLYLRESIIARLGLRPKRTWISKQAESRRVFSPVNLEIMGRSGTFDVIEVPNAAPNVVGHIPLHFIDWVVDEGTQCLTGNPEHGGEWIGEEYGEPS